MANIHITRRIGLVYSLEFVITVGLAAIVIGIITGSVITQRSAPSKRSQRQVENHLTELQQQQQDYQHEVNEHFSETANLLNQLTDSYQQVHNHLAKGAQLLATDSASESVKMIPSGTLTEEESAIPDSSITPPLDYAPKTAPNQPGMLNEEFGLDKKKVTENNPEATAGI